MKLNIPFFSQMSNQARNDCGAAVLSCLVDKPVDDVLRAIDQPPGQPLNFHHFYFALRYYNLPYAYSNSLTIAAIRESLDQFRPVILLLNYGRLPTALQARPYNGSHWVLAVGHEPGQIYVHDPMQMQEGGGFAAWDEAALKAAINDTTYNQVPRQGLIIRRAYPALAKVDEKMQVLGRIVATAEELRKEVTILTARLGQAEEESRIFRSYLQQLYQLLEIGEMNSTAEAQGQALAKVARLKQVN